VRFCRNTPEDQHRGLCTCIKAVATGTRECSDYDGTVCTVGSAACPRITGGHELVSVSPDHTSNGPLISPKTFLAARLQAIISGSGEGFGLDHRQGDSGASPHSADARAVTTGAMDL
jgi:hypothetical protein